MSTCVIACALFLFCLQFTYHYASPLGGITIASDGEQLTGLWFDDQKYFADTLDEEHEEKVLPVFEQTRQWLDIYFGGREPDFTPPLFMKTTDFRMAVWEIMLTIPYGKTMTYGEIADRIARQKGIAKMSARAVGGAVGHNSISLIIPCHRVMGANGSLTGYAGDIDKKVKLSHLDKEDGVVIFTFTPDFSIVQLDDFLGNRQSQAVMVVVSPGRIQLVKTLK